MSAVTPPQYRFRLSVLELEPRDVPAWWSVTAPDLTGGTLGDTSATHSGELVFNATYTPDASGKVAVFADTAVKAVADALAGTISVTLADGTVDYAFGPTTVGTTGAEQKPFLVEVNGDVVSIAFEDMAGQPGADYDYNDRTWDGTGVSAAANGGTRTLVSTIEDGSLYRTATLTSTVTMGTNDYPELYHWNYHLRNDTFDTFADPVEGIGDFVVNHDQVDAVQMMSNTRGWVDHPGGMSDSWAGGVDDASWWTKPGNVGIMPGEESDFWFYTEPRPIVTNNAAIWDLYLAAGAGSIALVPGPLPTVTLTVPEEIPVNANNDNKSPWKSPAQKFIPTTRDFDINSPTTFADPQLRPMSVSITNATAGTLEIFTATAGASKVSFWTDNKKSKAVSFVEVPAQNPNNTFVYDFYVEGKHESSSMEDKSVVRAVYATDGYASNSYEEILVTPVLKSFESIVPSSNLFFIENGPPANGLLGVTTKAPPDANGRTRAGIYFAMELEEGSDINKAGYIQNLYEISNGVNVNDGKGYGLVYRDPLTPFASGINDDAKQQGASLPLLDAAVGSDADWPFYGSDRFEGKIITEDSPRALWPGEVGAKIISLDKRLKFRIFVAVQYSDESIYTIAYWDWFVNYYADTWVQNQGMTHIHASSKVRTGGDWNAADTAWVRSNSEPPKTVGPVANTATGYNPV